FSVDCSKCPLFVVEGQTQPSAGDSAFSQRNSRRNLTLADIGITRRAAPVLPLATKMLPFFLSCHLMFSQRSLYASSGRIPVSNCCVIKAASSESAAAKYLL